MTSALTYAIEQTMALADPTRESQRRKLICNLISVGMSKEMAEGKTLEELQDAYCDVVENRRCKYGR